MNSVLDALNLQQTTNTLVSPAPLLLDIFFGTLSTVFNIRMSPCPLIAIFGVSPVVGRFTSCQATVIANL